MSLLGLMEQLLNLEISRFFLQKSDLECLLNLIARALSFLLENQDILKEESLKTGIIDILCLMVTKQEKGPKSGKDNLFLFLY